MRGVEIHKAGTGGLACNIVVCADYTICPDRGRGIGAAVSVAKAHFQDVVKTPFRLFQHTAVQPVVRAVRFQCFC